MRPRSVISTKGGRSRKSAPAARSSAWPSGPSSQAGPSLARLETPPKLERKVFDSFIGIFGNITSQRVSSGEASPISVWLLCVYCSNACFSSVSIKLLETSSICRSGGKPNSMRRRSSWPTTTKPWPSRARLNEWPRFLAQADTSLKAAPSPWLAKKLLNMAISDPLESRRALLAQAARRKIAMIEVYSWATPNGHKIHIMLEECGLAYRAIPIDIGAGAQFSPEFLAISPNNKIPAIVDPDGPDGKPISLFESGAILLYLAAKTGRFLPADVRGRYATLEWLMFQMGGVGPMLGQAHHFRLYAPEQIPYAVDRYSNEAKRLYGVLDARLAKSAFVAGAEYTIADIAIFPWLRSWKNQGVILDEYP